MENLNTRDKVIINVLEHIEAEMKQADEYFKDDPALAKETFVNLSNLIRLAREV